MSDVRSKNACDILYNRIKEEENKETNLLNQLNLMEPLISATKLRFMLEKLENVGRPTNISKHDWRYEIPKLEKWKILEKNQDNNPWIFQFLKCIDGQLEDTIRILYKISDKELSNFLCREETDVSIYKSPQITKVIACLKDLELEMLIFRSPFVHPKK